MVSDVAGDCVLEIGDGFEGASTDAPSGDGREEALDGIEPRRGCRGEMEYPAGMIGQPVPDLGMLA